MALLSITCLEWVAARWFLSIAADVRTTRQLFVHPPVSIHGLLRVSRELLHLGRVRHGQAAEAQFLIGIILQR